MPDAAAPIVWLAETPADAQTSAALSAWARSRSLTLVAPAEAARNPLPVDLAVAGTVEDLLDSARDAITARSGPEVDRALRAAQDLLTAHPELPNAAWLMAEVERGRSARWLRIAPVDIEAAQRAWSRAGALDAGRMAGAGEVETAPAPAAAITLQMRPSREAQIWVDGVPVGPGVFESRAGPHAVVVTWGGNPIWAAWVETSPGPSTVTLSALDAPACSSADLEQAHIAGDHVESSLAQCGRWIAAAPGVTPGSLRVADCHGDRCDSFADWRPPPVWTQPINPDQHERGRRAGGWPTWGTWGLVGAGVAVASAVVIGVVASSSRSSPSAAGFALGPLTTH